VLAVNPAYCSLYGFSPEQVVGQSFSLIIPEETRARAELVYREVFARGKPSLHQTRVRRADGVELLVEARATFIERRGKRVAMLSSIRELTAGRAAERHAAADDQAVLAVTGAHNGQPYRWEFRLVLDPDARLVVTDERVLDPGGSARLPLDVLRLDLHATRWPLAGQPAVEVSTTVEVRHDQVLACSCGGPPCPHAALYAWTRAHGWQPPEPSRSERLARLRDRALYLLNRWLGLTA
jgi:PAS domain S-box-containing protein